MPRNPTSQAFWVESTYGSGVQSLTWYPESVNNSLIIMNEDGSAGIDINLAVWTKEGILFMGGIGNLAIGVVVLLLSLFVLLLTGRSRNVVYPRPLPSLNQHGTNQNINS